jgi:isopenicillin-N epimerase
MPDNPLRGHFLLDADVVFLNHGSFGACPRSVLEVQAGLRDRIDRNPVRFLARELPALLDAARQDVARFVGARPQDLAFVRNATSGVSAVLRSLRFAPGDELLLTSHAYPACRRAAEFVARGSGATLRVANIPFPIRNGEQAVEAVLAAVTRRTRFALIEHVTSPTGLVLPIAPIVEALKGRGVDVLVDGAHGPGMLELSLEALGAAYYTGNFHKWCCAPRGAAMLWVREDRQTGIQPPVISHAHGTARGDARFCAEFDWTGTDDPTPWLCVPEALRFVGSLVPGGWPALRSCCRALALSARRCLADALEQAPAAPDEMIAFLAAQPLPDRAAAGTTSGALDPLQALLYDEHRIEVPVIPWPAPPRRLIRISAMVYNHLSEYQRLAAALRLGGSRDGRQCPGRVAFPVSSSGDDQMA